MGALFDVARSGINRLEALWEEIALFRSRDFRDSLREADEDLRTGQTISLADLRHELGAEDHRPLTY